MSSCKQPGRNTFTVNANYTWGGIVLNNWEFESKAVPNDKTRSDYEMIHEQIIIKSGSPQATVCLFSVLRKEHGTSQ